jgi:hypothetical protein
MWEGRHDVGRKEKKRRSMEGKRYIMELCMYKRKSLTITIPKG